MAVYDDRYLTIPELAERAHKKQAWLRSQAELKDDPMPTSQAGKQKLVLWSLYVEWYENRYGLDGYLRGQECLDIDIASKQPMKAKAA
jgi:hypothetical protein